MKRFGFFCFLVFYLSHECLTQITYADVKQNEYRRSGYGYSVCIETFGGSTPVFFSGGGFIVNSSYQELNVSSPIFRTIQN